jgi:hypothetical protein
MRWLALALMGLLAGCSSGTDDVVVEDASVPDTGPPPDGGVRALCPMLESPECVAFATCGEVLPAQSNCSGCFDYSKSLCTFGACERPEVLADNNRVIVRFNVEGALSSRVRSFASVGLAPETAGGAAVSCAQVYAGDVDLTNGCYNIVDSRGFPAAIVGDTYQAFFSRLPVERMALLILRGYEEEVASMEEPIGISCTEIEVGMRDGSGVDVEGDMMRLIQ